MGKHPFVSIIIPCKEIDEYAKDCVKNCKKIKYDNYEIIILPDQISEKHYGVQVISTGKVTPGKKRNIGIHNAKGDFCAFIDSDAYPKKDWLDNAMKYFEDPEVGGVGGPGITPKGDSLLQRASGYVLSSFLMSKISSRYKFGSSRKTDDIHSCNFIVRKSVLEEIGGWNEKYWPGEDTLMCLSISKIGKKLVETSDTIVFHHRRPLFRKHLKQISQFGLHRGFFAKKFPGNSFKFTLFLPSLILLFLLFGSVFSLFNLLIKNLFIIFLVFYGITALIASINKDIKTIIPVWFGIILTHIIYGLFFLIGLTKRELKK